MSNRQQKTNFLYLIALLFFLSGVSYLVYSGFSSSNVYFLNVSEALAATPEQLSQVRLFGTVAQDKLDVDSSARKANFLLEDKDNNTLTVPIVYQGMIPDAFKAGAEVIVEGGMQANKTFFAKTLMTKCPSKYQKENRGKL